MMETYLGYAPRGLGSFLTAMPVWLKEKLNLRSALKRELASLDGGKLNDLPPLLFTEHHQAHAASAFFASPFWHAAVLCLDGVGEWATTSLWLGEGNRLTPQWQIDFPHSLGLLYSAFTYYTGFKVNSGEYKVMGLAPYGEPRYVKLILDRLIDLKSDGSFKLDLSYFDYCTGLRMTNKAFDELFGGPPRGPDQLLTPRHMDLAASIQAVTDEVVLRLTRSLAAETGAQNLCLAGGVALNCVTNGKVLRDRRFRRVWVQPAAGDAGGALGAALCAYHLFRGLPRQVDGEHDLMQGSYLGPEFSQGDIEERLARAGARFTRLTDSQLIDRTVEALADGKAIGWFQGRIEFGPRALGARSILGDARSPSMQSVLNLKVKYRESFRPFAPSVLREDVADWFELDSDSPYMLMVADVAKQHRREVTAGERDLFGIQKLNVPRSSIPAVTHVDYSARIQTVHRDTNPRYHALLSAFKTRTGCPVIVNTSFNVRGEPIVLTPEDAFRCFMGTDIEVLAAGNCFLLKEDQNPGLRQDYRKAFSPD
jgi:carbamoyltransferase